MGSLKVFIVGVWLGAGVSAGVKIENSFGHVARTAVSAVVDFAFPPRASGDDI